MILFRLLAGRVPFEGEDRLAAGLRRAHEDAPRLRDVAPSLPPAACELVDRLLARAPALRPDALAAAQALGADASLLPGRETIASRARPAAEQLPVTLERPTRLWPGEDDLPTVLGPAAAPTTLVVRSSPRSGHRARPRGRAALLVAGAATVLALGGGVYAVASDPPTGIDEESATSGDLPR